MESEVLQPAKYEKFLLDALHETVSIVSKVEEKYQETAFPIILRSLIDLQHSAMTHSSSTIATNNGSDHNNQNLRLNPSISVNEFFRKAGPDSHPARFVCAAYYLLHSGKTSSFSIADILDIYSKLRQPKPGNPSDVIAKCIRKAHITDAFTPGSGQKSWVITPAGESYIEEMLHGNANSNG